MQDNFNPLNAELNPICHLLALLGGATIVVFSRLRVKVDFIEIFYRGVHWVRQAQITESKNVNSNPTEGHGSLF